MKRVFKRVRYCIPAMYIFIIIFQRMVHAALHLVIIRMMGTYMFYTTKNIYSCSVVCDRKSLLYYACLQIFDQFVVRGHRFYVADRDSRFYYFAPTMKICVQIILPPPSVYGMTPTHKMQLWEKICHHQTRNVWCLVRRDLLR